MGKIKNKNIDAAIKDYEKRMTKFSKLNIIELKDETNQINEDLVKKKEAIKIMDKLDKSSYIITLEVDKEQFTSEQLAEKLEKITTTHSKISFIIGGSYGIDEEIKNISSLSLSFSKLTFPHQLFRLIFLEQLYRSCNILNNTPYHK